MHTEMVFTFKTLLSLLYTHSFKLLFVKEDLTSVPF